MDLATYLTRPDVTLAQFAKDVGRDPSTIARWRRGDTTPNWKAMRAIATATKGEVTPSDFLKKREAAE